MGSKTARNAAYINAAAADRKTARARGPQGREHWGPEGGPRAETAARSAARRAQKVGTSSQPSSGRGTDGAMLRRKVLEGSLAAPLVQVARRLRRKVEAVRGARRRCAQL